MKYIHTMLVLCGVLLAPLYPAARPPVQSPYLQFPEKAIAYTDSCARFWLPTWDNGAGGFYSDVDKYGNPAGSNKNMLTQSRNAYGLVRAYMMTGDTLFLNMAEKALNFMVRHAWDSTSGGWYQELNAAGNAVNPTREKTAFYQHYALLGIAAYYEATADSTAWNWLLKGYNHLENYFWDDRAFFSGYFDATDFDGSAPRNKSFNATVDAVTTHLLYLYLLTGEPIYQVRLQEIAREMQDHLVAGMPSQAIGFVEKYNSEWYWNNNETMTLMGHVLKTGWCLARICQVLPDSAYLADAEYVFREVWEKGYDQELGGPYKDFNRQTGELLLWGLPDTTKAWWQMEQAVVAGLQLYDLTGDSFYLQVADESLDFFMKYFVDHQFGEVYADRTRYGGFAWSENKGSGGKAGYHSIELGYYTYLYGQLLYRHQPAALHYYFKPSPTDRQVTLTPLAISNAALRIQEVLREGQPYADYHPDTRVLNLPAGTGGHFQVTYQRTPATSLAQAEDDLTPGSFRLRQNYPNPFNPSTTIEFTLPASGFVTLKIYNVLGEEAATLVSERLTAGSYKYDWSRTTGMASGVYLYSLTAGDFRETKKMILMK